MQREPSDRDPGAALTGILGGLFCAIFWCGAGTCSATCSRVFGPIPSLALGCLIVGLGGRFWRASQDATRSEELYGTQAPALAAELDPTHPSAAASLREGIAETRTGQVA